MILASIDWLSTSINLLLIVFVAVCLLMSLLILMQRPKQEGLGAAFGSGMTDQMFGARTTNVLQRGTVYLAAAFFILTLALAILYARQNENRASMVKDEPEAVEETVEPAVVDEAPASLEEQLKTASDKASTPASEGTDEASTSEEIPAAEQEAPAVDESASAEETPAAEGTPAEEETPAGDEPADASGQ